MGLISLNNDVPAPQNAKKEKKELAAYEALMRKQKQEGAATAAAAAAAETGAAATATAVDCGGDR